MNTHPPDARVVCVGRPAHFFAIRTYAVAHGRHKQLQRRCGVRACVHNTYNMGRGALDVREVDFHAQRTTPVSQTHTRSVSRCAGGVLVCIWHVLHDQVPRLAWLAEWDACRKHAQTQLIDLIKMVVQSCPMWGGTFASLAFTTASSVLEHRVAGMRAIRSIYTPHYCLSTAAGKI